MGFFRCGGSSDDGGGYSITIPENKAIEMTTNDSFGKNLINFTNSTSIFYISFPKISNYTNFSIKIIPSIYFKDKKLTFTGNSGNATGMITIIKFNGATGYSSIPSGWVDKPINSTTYTHTYTPNATYDIGDDIFFIFVAVSTQNNVDGAACQVTITNA